MCGCWRVHNLPVLCRKGNEDVSGLVDLSLVDDDPN